MWHLISLQLDEDNDFLRFNTIAGGVDNQCAQPLFLGGIAHYSFALLQGCLLLKLYEGLLLTALLKEGDKNPFQDAEGMLKMVASGEYHIVTSYIGNWSVCPQFQFSLVQGTLTT